MRLAFIVMFCLAACGTLQARGHGSVGGGEHHRKPRPPTAQVERETMTTVLPDELLRDGIELESAAVQGATTTVICLPLPLTGPGGVAYRAVIRWGWHTSFEAVTGGRP